MKCNRRGYLFVSIGITSFVFLAQLFIAIPVMVPDQVSAYPHPAIPSQSSSTHWYAGSLCKSGILIYAQSLEFTMYMPSSLPSIPGGGFFYVLISCFDTSKEYIQLGISNAYNKWSLTTSYTSGDATTYHYNPCEMYLQSGTEYRFVMTIGYGYVGFTVWQGSSQIFHKTAWTGGSHFRCERITNVNGANIIGFTDYEEIWWTNDCPYQDFKFKNTKVDCNLFDDWNTWYAGSPSDVRVTIGENYLYQYVNIDNNYGTGGGGGRVPR
ncbi:MAG: hypothetical protein RTU30_08595 [Candidatus Thorarchaeota archaeon]